MANISTFSTVSIIFIPAIITITFFITNQLQSHTSFSLVPTGEQFRITACCHHTQHWKWKKMFHLVKLWLQTFLQQRVTIKIFFDFCLVSPVNRMKHVENILICVRISVDSLLKLIDKIHQCVQIYLFLQNITTYRICSGCITWSDHPTTSSLIWKEKIYQSSILSFLDKWRKQKKMCDNNHVWEWRKLSAASVQKASNLSTHSHTLTQWKLSHIVWTQHLCSVHTYKMCMEHTATQVLVNPAFEHVSRVCVGS